MAAARTTAANVRVNIEVSRVVCVLKQVKLWKSCGRLVNFLWMDRHLKFFFGRVGRRKSAAAFVCALS
jgi:hypothetical protein